jgi:hypothetical protein
MTRSRRTGAPLRDIRGRAFGDASPHSKVTDQPCVPSRALLRPVESRNLILGLLSKSQGTDAEVLDVREADGDPVQGRY